jgi:hypothetical protein
MLQCRTHLSTARRGHEGDGCPGNGVRRLPGDLARIVDVVGVDEVTVIFGLDQVIQVSRDAALPEDGRNTLRFEARADAGFMLAASGQNQVPSEGSGQTQAWTQSHCPPRR